MFDPFLRVLKGSQLLFVSAIFSFTSPSFATDSGPTLDLQTEVEQQSIDFVVEDNDTTEVMIEPLVILQEKTEEAPSVDGPEIVIETKIQTLEDKDGLENQTPAAQVQSLGPLLSAPQKNETQKPDLLPRFPFSNYVVKEKESLDLLWQKTFPSHSTPEQKAPLITLDPAKVTPQESSEQDTVLVDNRPFITIIIDDLGYNRRGMEESLSLPVEVTLAILPHTPFSKKTAHAATEQERTIMLHVPMENERELKLGPGGLYRNMDETELKDTLKKGIESVPGISGINNHMGSLLTQDVERMKWVMEVIQPMELFFVDSLTSPNSVALAKALTFNLTTTRRDVFLDNVQDEKAIDLQFQRLLKIARKRGKALAIGHPYPSTMSYLSKRLTQLEEEGIRLVSIADYVEEAN
jgi:polysaccharide deacetylase 2 family uncharacterized protein YibQ